MVEILVSATLLILMVMLLRHLSKGRIGMRYRYALWMIVAVRLVVPVSFGSSSFSILNLTSGWSEGTLNTVKLPLLMDSENSLSDEMSDNTDNSINGDIADIGDIATEEANTGGVDGRVAGDILRESIEEQDADFLALDGRGTTEGGEAISDTDSFFLLSLMRDSRIQLLALIIWVVGIVCVGGYMLVSQRRFVRYLHRSRTEAPGEELPGSWGRRLEARRMHLYLLKGLPSPCLVGHDIYIEPRLLEEKDRLQHVLAHEYAHSVQGDTFWAFVRSLLCAIYWFYPLVWLAAYESRKDSELACDEYVIRMLGETERFAYGRTLIALLSGRDRGVGYTGAVLIMDGRESSVKERITVIAGKRKNSKTVAVIVALTAVCVCGCAFTGAVASDDSSAGKGKQFLLTNEGSLSPESVEEAETTEEEQMQTEKDEEEQESTELGVDERAQSTEQQGDDRRQKEMERDAKDAESFGEEAAMFREILDQASDSELASAEMVDLAEYYNYLYKGAESPLIDGQWYKLQQTEETGIDFYGFYTQDYGFRGLKIKIGDDVNTFDEPWLPVSFGIDVVILEETETDGEPRSFAFKICVVNTSESEIWRLYVADRYDTGTIELSCLNSYDCQEQLKDQKVTLSVNQEAKKVDLVYDGDVVVGSVDISDYADEKIEEAIWDDGVTSFRLEEDGQITFLTGIGLRAAEGGKTFYKGLSVIGCLVETGDFGNRKFTIGRPYVMKNYVSARLNP